MEHQSRTSRLAPPGPGPGTLHDVAPAPVDETVVGTVLGGRYRIEGCIGSGAMGVVWTAWDRRLRRTVAVKQLAARGYRDATDERVARARAMREGRIAARVVHPRAIAVFDVVVNEAGPWLVMEYLPSRSLAALLAEHGPLAPTEAAWVGAQVADALGAVHEAGIVHGDIKPGNVLITDDGVAKITDFGVSRAKWDTTATGGGTVAGTPGYFAPEVARGEEPTPASDVFSLGATLYAAVENELVCGHHDNTLAVLHAMAEGRLRPATRAGVLGRPLAAMLRLEAGHRPDTAAIERALRARAGTRPFVPAPGSPDAGATSPAGPVPRPLATADLPATVDAADSAAGSGPAARDAGPETPRVGAAAGDVAAGRDEDLVPVGRDGEGTESRDEMSGGPTSSESSSAWSSAPAVPPVPAAGPTLAPTPSGASGGAAPGLAARAAAGVAAAGGLRAGDGAGSSAPVRGAAGAAVASWPLRTGMTAARRSPTTTPAAGTARRRPTRQSRPRTTVVAAASGLLLAVGLGVAVAAGSGGGSLAVPAAPPPPSAERAPVDPLGGAGAPETPTSAPRVAAPLSPADPSQPPSSDPGTVVVDYYASLPGDIDGAWAVLSDDARDDSGGYEGYRRFWSSIRDVHATDVSVHGDTVSAEIQFTTASGRTSRENYRFEVDRDDDGQVRIQHAERSSDSS